MAEAKITVTLAPAEFDHVRNAVQRDVDNQIAVGNDASVDPATRREAKAEAVVGSTILEKLR